jgi:uncharacterized membrane protein
MLYQQKESIVIIGLAGLCLLLFLVLTLGFGASPERAFASFSLFAVVGLLPVVKRKQKAFVDERDKKIDERASFTGFAVFWVAFVACAMYVYFSMGYEGCIPVVWATNAVIGGLVLVFTTRAITQLVLYRKGVE